jgi:hypothetical protein
VGEERGQKRKMKELGNTSSCSTRLDMLDCEAMEFMARIQLLDCLNGETSWTVRSGNIPQANTVL